MHSTFFRIPILYRYVFKEILIPFLITLFVFTGVLFLIRSLKMADLVINKGIPIKEILLLFSYIIPPFMELAIPMSLMLAIMLAFGRFSQDSELIVIRASGLSLTKLLPPVILFAVLSFLLTLLLSLYIRPYANYNLSMGMFNIAKKRISSSLIPGIFNELGDLTIYASSINNRTGRLKNVIIADRRLKKDPKTF